MTEQATKKAAKPAKRKQTATDDLPMPRVFKSQAEAVSFGLPRPLVSKAKAAGCAAFRADGRILRGELIKWIFSQKGDAVIDWQARLTKAKAEREELRLAKERGELGDRGEMEDAIRQMLAHYDACHERNFLTVMPPKAVGLTAPEISQLNKSIIGQARREAVAIFEKLGREAEPTEAKPAGD